MREQRGRRRKGKTGTARKEGAVLDRLKPDETGELLRRLLAARPDLRAEAEAHARSLLGEVTFKAVARDVEDALKSCDFCDLSGRAGKRDGGYVEPTEAAWEILEETLEPFVSDMRRRLGLGLDVEALAICKGVVLGLYRFEHGEDGELREWAPDFPGEAAANAIEAWLTRGRTKRQIGRAFPQDFVERFVPEWRDMIDRLSTRRSRG